MDPVDIAAASRRVTMRRRWQTAIAAGAVAAAVTAATAAAVALAPDGGRSDPPVASSDGAVPWVDQRPSEDEGEAARACDAQDVTPATGRSGAWHGMTTQQIVLSNSTHLACTLSAGMSVDVTAETGSATSVDMSAVEGSGVELSAGQSAQVMLGTPASCGGASVSIARDLIVTLAGGEAVQLHGAWLPFGCGDPQAISLQADPVEPATQQIKISAELSDLGSAVAGGTLDFTVTLTSRGQDPVSFAECPSYSMGIKEAGVSERYLLNCSDVDAIPAGDSVTYAMRLEVPADAAGTDVLTWSLDGYAAVDSADISTS